MDAKLLHPSLYPNHCYLRRARPLSTSLTRLRLRLRLHLLRATNDNEVASTGDKPSGDLAAAKDTTSVPASPSPPPPTTLNIRYRRRSRNQARQQSARKPPPKKDWESMTLGEKAVELYVGEKGLLFWLNKFAYASIFIIAGGWILFRFVGPSLGLYQLDSAPLAPSAIFKG